jgi:cell wall-associated NlpC family hydrolase
MLRLRLILVLCACVCALHLPARAAATPNHETRTLTARVELGKKIAKYARTFIGVQYRYGGMSPRGGFDCSGLVAYVYDHFGITLPHYTVSQYQEGRRVRPGKLRAGDLVFFGLGHVGMYIGKGRFIHAPHTGARVRVEKLFDGWYRHRFTAARRILHS